MQMDQSLQNLNERFKKLTLENSPKTDNDESRLLELRRRIATRLAAKPLKELVRIAKELDHTKP